MQSLRLGNVCPGFQVDPTKGEALGSGLTRLTWGEGDAAAEVPSAPSDSDLV